MKSRTEIKREILREIKVTPKVCRIYECFYCKERNVDSFNHLMMCCDCEIRQRQNESK